MYIPHTEADREAMLEAIGVSRLEDLFQAVPAAHRFPNLDLPPGLTEMEALAEMQELAYANSTTPRPGFLPGRRRLQPLHPRRGRHSSCAAASSTPPTPPTSRRCPRARCRPSSSTRA